MASYVTFEETESQQCSWERPFLCKRSTSSFVSKPLSGTFELEPAGHRVSVTLIVFILSDSVIPLGEFCPKFKKWKKL